ncbi:MAG: protein-disulfide reductase DsbD domain-containing protein [Pseudaminobacter sp.]
MTHVPTALWMALAAALGTTPAVASSTDWFETQGGRIRLVTTGTPDTQGQITGVLDIALDPGWKTYWRDPGDSGVPPSLKISASSNNVKAAEIAFPPPQRHDDGYSKWAGYDRSVSLPVTFTLASPEEPALIDADIFLGICETVCIPVQAQLLLDPAADPDNVADAAIVSQALKALPAPAAPDFGVTVFSKDDTRVVVEAKLPEGATSAEFFIAGADGYTFGTPERFDNDRKVLFSVEILNRPKEAPTEGGLHYTLVTSSGSVSGILPYL